MAEHTLLEIYDPPFFGGGKITITHRSPCICLNAALPTATSPLLINSFGHIMWVVFTRGIYAEGIPCALEKKYLPV